MFARVQIDEVHDEGGLQRISGRGLNGERFDGAHSLIRLQGHGLTSVPTKGSTGLAVFPNGDRGRGYLIGVESDGLRHKAQPGGSTVLYGANGEVVSLIESKCRIVSGEITMVGAVKIQGSITCNGKNISDTHVHGGVLAGGANTGVPA